MCDILSHYPTTDVYSDSIAEINAQHLHINFDKDKLVILNCAHQTLSSLTSIVFLSQGNENIPLHNNDQKTKLHFSIDNDTITRICEGYHADPWCTKLLSASHGMTEINFRDGLWFLNKRLIVPSNCGIQE
jgi:hypothetical protein